MVERLTLIVLVVALAGWGALRPRRVRLPPAQIPAAQVQPWMVDALPGVGPKRHAAALAAVQAGRFEDLPKAARATAEQVFERPTAPR